jgi:hypothetical protein
VEKRPRTGVLGLGATWTIKPVLNEPRQLGIRKLSTMARPESIPQIVAG